MGSCASIVSKERVSPEEKYERKRNSVTVQQQELVQQFTSLAQNSVDERERNHLGILSTRQNTFKIGTGHDSLQALALDTKLRSIPPKAISDTEHLYDVLKKHWIFRETSDDALFSIIENIYNVSVEKGAEIITQGADGDAFYVIASGKCHVVVDGVKKPFEMEKDDTFGELALFFNCARTATVVAATSCVLWKLESIAMKVSVMQYHEQVEQQNVEFLEKMPEMQPYIGSNHIKRLAQILAPMVYTDGDEIITQGDVGNIFYILEEGECKIVVDGVEKEERLKPGQWFGEAALIMSAPRSASIIAIGECKCLALDKHNFVKVLVRTYIHTYIHT
jgi:CRP-like cAMP-binding protein